MVNGGPNVDMAVNASCCKVLILEIAAKRHDLNDMLGMSHLNDVQLVLELQSVDNEIATAQSANEKVTLFATDGH